MANLLPDLNKILESNSEDIKIQEVTDQNKDIAIIGMDLKFSMADNYEQFWENLVNETDCIRSIPSDRKNEIDQYVKIQEGEQEDHYREIAYLDDISSFDYEFFHLSPKESSLMDPNQRLFLQCAWKTMEDAGYGENRIRGTRTGIYVGYKSTLSNVYYDMIRAVDPEELGMAAVGNKTSVIASRIAHILDLKGPNMIIDTACSSSLVAIHLACQALREKECDIAIAGSIRLDILPIESRNKLGIESEDGRTKTFDRYSDGTGGGEGVAAIMLKPLSNALKEKDYIYAVIKGSAVNHDGRSIGITAPNANAQEDVIIRAMKSAGVSMDSISYIEAHGTGTKLGDPIELEGLTRAFSRYTNRHQFCGIGSVKSNIGHLDNCSGMAGIIKAALSLKNKKIPASIHFCSPNREIDFINSPFYVCDHTQDWESSTIRRCGISGFGLSGTNCHIILEEAPENKESIIYENKKQVLTISAKSEEALFLYIKEYQAYVRHHQREEYTAICQTSNCGRGHYNYRLAIIVESYEDLKNKLLRINKLKNLGKHLYYGVHIMKENDLNYMKEGQITKSQQMELTREAQYLWNQERETLDEFMLEKLCTLYIQGADIPWSNMWAIYQKASIPTYAFEHKKCWIDMKKLQTKSVFNMKLPEQAKEEIEQILKRYSLNIQKETKNQENSIELKGRSDSSYTDLEKELAQVYSNVLGINIVDIDDEFYKLGGDSLIAVKIANRFHYAYQHKIEIVDILKFSTIRKLASFINSNTIQKTDDIEEYELIKVNDRECYPLSSPQKRMFVMDWFKNIKSVYNMNRVFLVTGLFDLKKTEAAFRGIIKNQESLRTSFLLKEEGPVQIIHDEVELHIEYMEAREEQIKDIVREFFRPFHLEQAPLFRVGIIKLTSIKHILIMDMHHIISDGTSTGIIMDDFIKLYQGEDIKPVEFQYRDYTSWQIQNKESKKMRREREYWKNVFHDSVPVLDLPLDYERPKDKVFKGNKVTRVLDSSLTQSIKEMAEKDNFTLHILLLSAYYILLSKYSNQEDIVVGVASSGRNRADIERTVGMFVNTLAMRNYPSFDKTFYEFLIEVRERSYKAYENQDYQLDDLVEQLNIKRDTSRNPLFDAVFTLTKYSEVKCEGLTFSVLDLDEIKARFDLILSLCDYGDHIDFGITYCTALFKKETIENMAEDYQNIICMLLKNKYILIGDIQLINQKNVLTHSVEEIQFDF